MGRKKKLGDGRIRTYSISYDSLEIRPVNCDKWRLPMMATYFFGTKISADCCLHSYDKMSNEPALLNPTVRFDCNFLHL
jgi:hypothetical protein